MAICKYEQSYNNNRVKTIHTALNIVISRNFLVWKLCGKAQFPQSFEQFVRNYEENVHFHKISTAGN